MSSDDDYKITDQVIANDALVAAKGAASAYLTAALESATPDVRRVFGEYLSQCLMSHEAMTALCIKKGWYKPYMAPEEQIAETFSQAEWVLNANT